MAKKKYLNIEGVSHLWELIIQYFTPRQYFNLFASQVSNSLDTKAEKVDTELTGTPTAPTAAAGTSTNQIATTEFVMQAIENYNNELLGLLGIDDTALSVIENDGNVTIEEKQ